MLRLSQKPSKQLLYLWLWRYMRLSQNKVVGIDAGCGFMDSKPMFQTQKYIGIDVDGTRLKSGMERYPDATAVMSRLEDVRNISGDFVLCVQVLHNRHFDTERTALAVRRLTELVRPGGILIFNIGRKNMVYENELDCILKAAFRSVTKRPYGAFSAAGGLFSPFLAGLMYLIPPLRTVGGVKKILYICKSRVPTNGFDEGPRHHT